MTNFTASRRALLKGVFLTAAAGAAPSVFAAPGSRVLVVYYSRAGENYSASSGTAELAVGHTARIAKRIAEVTKADIFEIQTAEPYPKGYRDTTSLVQKEQASGVKRAIKMPLPDLSKYDTVFIGHPIWWGQLPPPVVTYLSQSELSGKTVAHFCTHAGSGFGRTDSELKKMFPKAKFTEGFAVYGEEAAGSLGKAEAWVKKIGY